MVLLEMSMQPLYLGVDVGSHSVRCAVVSHTGRILSTSIHPIATFSPKPDYFQQSSDDIWQSTCAAVKAAMKGYSSKDVKGIGFDATCSLVVLDESFEAVSISPNEEPEQNVILWMDHRAKEEADEINNCGFDLLKFVGGKISLEMEPPKIMWLKKNLRQQWQKVAHAFDLPDFLTWKATGTLSRSLCSLVCKMMFQANEKELKWDKQFWIDIQLDEVVEDNFRIIGCDVLPPGTPIGQGINQSAAIDLGLEIGTPVGASMIDAHAGGVGCLGCQVPGISPKFSSRLVMICGTSTCHMAVNEQKIFVSGVWGPYYSAMVPGFWLNEAGQSAAGALIDHVINTHPASATFKETLPPETYVQMGLNELSYSLAKKRGLSSVSHLTHDLHVWPDFHGNRSPVADPTLKGMISGLSLSANVEDLACLYLATLQALAYSTRHILYALESSGHKITSIIMCGGLSKNRLYAQMHADVTGLPVILPQEEESVLLGAAILGAAATAGESLQNAMKNMGGNGFLLQPALTDKIYHEKKYKVFLSMLEHQRNAKNEMKNYM